MSRVLVFTTCYNEEDNIGPLIDGIVEQLPDADLLIVDDNSPDGTWQAILELAKKYPQLTPIQRPGKMGIGTAHKYAVLYAMRESYDTLVTMDADWSHDPKYLPQLVAAGGDNAFVTGSRYCRGGTSDYTGYRNLVSRVGNIAARLALGIRLHEFTTFYRVFDVKSLRRLPLRHVNANGYSYGVQLIYYLKRAGVALREVPIHFADRKHGVSKIPRLQIIFSALDLVTLAANRFNAWRDSRPDTHVNDACANCGDRVLSLKHFATSEKSGESESEWKACRHNSFTSRRTYPAVYSCLCCGLQQVPNSVIPRALTQLYEQVSDEDCLANESARERTFARAFDQMQPSLPNPPGRMLEVGAYCGLFAREATQRGWRVDAAEPSRWAAKYARERLGLNIYPGTLSVNRENLREKYDAVVALDVLEHLADPLSFVREAAAYLNPGGIFCFSTLDVDTWFPRVTGRYWPWLMAMHVQYFDRHVLKDLLSRAGFALKRAEPYAHYARMRYAVQGLGRALPGVIGYPLIALSEIIPNDIMLPVKFGDIKLYVAKKL